MGTTTTLKVRPVSLSLALPLTLTTLHDQLLDLFLAPTRTHFTATFNLTMRTITEAIQPNINHSINTVATQPFMTHIFNVNSPAVVRPHHIATPRPQRLPALLSLLTAPRPTQLTIVLPRPTRSTSLTLAMTTATMMEQKTHNLELSTATATSISHCLTLGNQTTLILPHLFAFKMGMIESTNLHQTRPMRPRPRKITRYTPNSNTCEMLATHIGNEREFTIHIFTKPP